MKEALAGLFGSKKVLTAVIASAVSFLLLTAAKHGYALSEDQAMFLTKGVLAIAGAVVLGQGLADFGKEKAKIEATLASPEEPAAPQPPSS
jgi:hypothetical protein